MNNNPPILEIKDLTKRFGGVVAVDGLSLEIRKKEIVGIVGPNGSGKTTLINLICGFSKPDEGVIRLEGKDIGGLSAHRVAKMGIARTFQVLRPFYSVPACHNVVLSLLSPRAKKIRHFRRFGQAEQTAMDLMELLGFERRSDAYRPTMTLPPGYLRRLDIARAVATEPELLLLDEPFSELTSVEAVSVRSALLKLNSLGLTILMIEHRFSYIIDIVHRVIGMHEGRSLVQGTAEKVMEEERFRKIYYG
ncbi:MAG: ATP-binding cassette domain-containing protein [Thermodesulfobacteriota bacterium]|nr:ATP-binding cassette domain-containing protein [Thermodesulfobacteriota bacterium]